MKKSPQEELLQAHGHYRTMVEWTPEAIIVHRDGKILYVNPAAVRLFGAKDAGELIGSKTSELIHPDCREAQCARMNSIAQNITVKPMVEARFLKLDGSAFDVEVQGTAIAYAGAPALHVSVRDISERKRAEAKLQLAHSVFTHAREGIMITNARAEIIDINEAGCRISGYGREELLGQNPRVLSAGRKGKEFYAAMWHELNEAGHWQGELWNRRKNGELYAEMITISVVRDAHGDVLHYAALFSDITTAKAQQDKLEHIAHFDILTGLPNRVLLADRLHLAMADAQRRGKVLALAYLDLDGFKAINDNRGHEAGDQLLVALARRMTQVLRDGDTLARLGGDEFVAVLPDLLDVAACEPLLERLLAAAAQPVQIGNLMLQVSASLGVTFHPQDQQVDADQLLRQADQAMYQAKLSGKNRFHAFDTALDSSIRGHHERLERIRKALDDGEFVLYFQPKVNMRSGQVIGVEALVRWQHPLEGLLPPIMFLPLIENDPMAVQLGDWVIETALGQMERWQSGGMDIPVSVNVGTRQLMQSDFVSRLRSTLAAHPQVRPGDFELEMLESSALDSIDQLSRVIEACRDLGVNFALDDFGTGYSSLTYLKRLPVSLLKIDQSFVSGMLDDPDDLAILEGVIGLASAFSRRVIAEGVESVAHGAMLLQLGCELGQGYGISGPLRAQEVPTWALAWRPSAAWRDLPAASRDDFPLLASSVRHRAWMSAFAGFLKGERDMPPRLQLHEHSLRNWIEGVGLARHADQPAYAFIEMLHQTLHALAAELSVLHAWGCNDEAQERLGELQGMSDALLEQLQLLVQLEPRL